MALPVAKSSTPRHHRSTTTAQDGALRGWLVVFGAFLNLSAGFGVINSFGTYQNYYTSQSIMTSTASGTIASLQLCLLLCGGIIVGPLFDRFGARHLICTGTAICLIAYLICAFRHDVTSLVLAQGVLLGIRNATLFHPAVNAISGWFISRRAVALGLAVSGSSFGGIAWPLITDAVLKNPRFDTTDDALKWSFIVIFLISFVLMGSSCWLIRENSRSPLPGTPPPATPVGYKTRMRRNQILDAILLRCLTKLQIALTAALMLIFIGAMLPFTFIPLRAGTLEQAGESWPNYLLTICYSASMFGRVIPTWLGDCYGRFNVYIVMSISAGLVIMAWPFMTDLPSLVMFSILYGFASGSLIPLGTACVVQLSPDLEKTGLRTGIVLAISSVGVMSTGPICGMLWGSAKTREQHAMEYVTGGLTLFGAVILAGIRLCAESRFSAKV